MHFFPLHVGDWAADTAHLSAMEEGFYFRLVSLYYRHESPLSTDPRALCRLVRARTDEECAAVACVLEEFFFLSPEGWRHHRCDEEIAKVDDVTTKRQKAARARWDKPVDKSPPVANATKAAASAPEACTCNANAMQVECTQYPIPNTQDLNPLQPPSSTALTGVAHELDPGGDDDVQVIPDPPESPAQWVAALKRDHGLQIDPLSPHDRRRYWPILTRWAKAGIPLARFDDAYAEALATAAPLASPIAYVDAMFANAQAPPRAAASLNRDQGRALAAATIERYAEPRRTRERDITPPAAPALGG